MASYNQTMNFNNDTNLINGQQHHINTNGNSQTSTKTRKLESIGEFSKKYRLVYLPIIEHILNNSNLETITIKKIREELEDRLEFEFVGEGKDLIKQLIVLIFDDFITKKQMEEVEEEEEENKTSSSRSSSKRKKAKKNDNDATPKVRRTGGINIPLKLSAQMADFTGVTQLSRPQIVKRVWEHIKEHNLQEPTNRNNINNDATLETLFGVKTMTSFGMAKLISPHVSKLEPHEIIKTEEIPQAE